MRNKNESMKEKEEVAKQRPTQTRFPVIIN